MHAIQSQTRLKRFLVLLEPLAILGISVVLGGIMISVMLAITSLTNVL
jgi:type II secretory pathway component PulF